MGLNVPGGLTGGSGSPLNFGSGLEETTLVDIFLEHLAVERVLPGACCGADRILTRRRPRVVSYRDHHLGAFIQLQRLQRFYFAMVVAGLDRLNHQSYLSFSL